MENNFPIDFVVLWVNPLDKNWATKKKYWAEKELGSYDDDPNRYRNWEVFKYWFRAVERFAPWVRKVHLVTDSQVPDFLNIENPKIELVFHISFMRSDTLPSFNSNAIELQIPYIGDLAEHFVYFNDDVFLVKPVHPEDFFKNGKCVDVFCERSLIRYYDCIFYRIMAYNRKAVNKHFKKREVIKQIGLKKWLSSSLPLSYKLSNLLYLPFNKFVGFSVEHSCVPYLKTECLKAIDTFEEEYEQTILSKFRRGDNLCQYIFRYWNIVHNLYEINKQSRCHLFNINEIDKIRRLFDKDFKYPVLCLNDSSHIDNYEEAKIEIKDLLESFLPNKSDFEK